MPYGMEGEAISSERAVTNNMYEKAYCLFCWTGREGHVVSELTECSGVRALFPQRIKTERRNGRWFPVRKPLLPGYVFLYASSHVEFSRIRRLSHVVRVLQYEGDETALRGADLAFADLVWKHEGVLGVSKVLKEGDRVQIVEGPLKDLGGIIIQLDSHKRIARLELDLVGSTQRIWLSFDYLQ